MVFPKVAEGVPYKPRESPSATPERFWSAGLSDSPRCFSKDFVRRRSAVFGPVRGRRCLIGVGRGVAWRARSLGEAVFCGNVFGRRFGGKKDVWNRSVRRRIDSAEGVIVPSRIIIPTVLLSSRILEPLASVFPAKPARGGPIVTSPPDRVLCVDDSPTCLATVCMVARRAGYSPVSAKDGRDALAKFRASALDGHPALAMLVTDFDMPEMSGVDLARELCQAGFAGPVVFFTAKETVEVQRKCSAAGIVPTAVVSKPDLRALAAALKPAVESSRAG